MSVLVKNMKMPKNCEECPLGEYEDSEWFCCSLMDMAYRHMTQCDRLDDCPLVELPEKHGDLIDRDALKLEHGMKDDCADCDKELRGKSRSCEFDREYTMMDFCGWLDDAHIVIEAEGVKE